MYTIFGKNNFLENKTNLLFDHETVHL